MKQEKFLDMMADVLDTDQALSMDTQLGNMEEWDSLAILSFLAEAGAHAKEKIDAKKVKSAQTIGDLFVLFTK